MLAGRSFGGLYVQLRRPFPRPGRRLVLLDSTAPKPGPAPPPNTDPYDVIGRVAALSAASAHLGADGCSTRSPTPLFRHALDEARATSSTASALASSEEYAVANTSMQQAPALTSLDGKLR